ncbi:hypothetical protein SAY86_000280 [Trapa natans]|uniref:Non-specific lipid-transfer protein n=1 Tax=Trapa natans TaxID=22666 RepID=A0AAN7MBS7_TRANT|nr:hypothetical protein SAY86_000280 [Trapa natans]
MASISNHILKLTSCLLVVYLILATPKAVTAAITCGQVASKLAPCLQYAKSNGAGPVPPACCNGIKAIAALAQTTPDRKTACNCLKSFSSSVSGINYGTVANLPSKCGVNIPYKISPSTNCNSVQ